VKTEGDPPRRRGAKKDKGAVARAEPVVETKSSVFIFALLCSALLCSRLLSVEAVFFLVPYRSATFAGLSFPCIFGVFGKDEKKGLVTFFWSTGAYSR
jgi:hypothetical protein